MLLVFFLAINDNEASISEISRELEIANNNLRKHIDTLTEMDMIKTKVESNGRKKSISLNIDNQKNLCLIRGIVEYFAFNLVEETREMSLSLNTKFIKELGLIK